MPGDGSPPLTPDSSTARGWLARELAKPAYADQRSLLQRLWDWAMDRLDDLVNGLGAALPLYVLIPLLLALAALVVAALTRVRTRGAKARAERPDGVLADIALTADELRRRATRSESTGDHSAAFVDLFRAIARRAEERALLLPQPGRTAHEVAVELAPYFLSYADALRDAAAHFDTIRYGGADAAPGDVDRIRALDRDVDGARPAHPSSPRAVR